MTSFLDALKQRVIVFDGGMGTQIHARDLTLDDFGGPTYEGCPEILVATRPADHDAVCGVPAACRRLGRGARRLAGGGARVTLGSMIPKSVYRFSDEIMLEQKA